jgi:hypothetical protein
MFAKTFVTFATAVALSTSALAAPTHSKRTSYSPVSFNNWGGYESLSNFDDFYGVDNFSGYHNTIVVDEEQPVVVCHSQPVEIIQQQLAVIREYAKRIVTEQICEVEVQTVVYSQFLSGFHDFSSDLLRQSGRGVGYDHHIASLIGQIHDSSGNIVFNDLGFKGSDIGSSFVVPSGSNWNDASSPLSVGSAFGLSVAAGGLA